MKKNIFFSLFSLFMLLLTSCNNNLPRKTPHRQTGFKDSSPSIKLDSDCNNQYCNCKMGCSCSMKSPCRKNQ